MIFLLGVAMMAAGVWGKKKSPKETTLMNNLEALLPSSWDETEITRGIERYQGQVHRVNVSQAPFRC